MTRQDKLYVRYDYICSRVLTKTKKELLLIAANGVKPNGSEVMASEHLVFIWSLERIVFGSSPRNTDSENRHKNNFLFF